MTKLESAIAYDVEHDLFHSQNVFSDEYITPTFIKYVEELEKENAQLKKDYEETEELLTKQIEATLRLDKENAELKEKLDFISKNAEPAGKMLVDMAKSEVEKAEQGKLAELIQEKYNLEYKIENLENKIEHQQEVIDVFKKKNAELKEKNNNLVTSSKTIISLSDDIEARTMEQLAKAKEIIKKLLKTPQTIYKRDEDGEVCPYFNAEYDVIVKQAERFLSEEEN